MSDSSKCNKKINNPAQTSDSAQSIWTTKLILENVAKVINRSKDPLLLELKKSNKLLFLDKLINENSDFFNTFPTTFGKAAMGMTEEDINQLGEILATNDMIREGKISRQRGEYIFGKKLVKKYAPDLLDETKACPD